MIRQIGKALTMLDRFAPGQLTDAAAQMQS